MNKNQEGFTLIEILIAITITAIILGAVFSFFDIGFSIWERTNRDGDWRQELRVFDKVLKRDLHNIYTSPIYHNKFKGDYRSMKFLMIEDEQLVEVSYNFNSYGNEVIRTLKSIGTKTILSRSQYFANINVTGLDFSFYGQDNDYGKTYWEYENEAELPVAVKLDIFFKNEKNKISLIIDIFQEKEYYGNKKVEQD